MRNRFSFLAAAFVCASLSATAFAADEGFGGNVGLVIGQKTFHKNDYQELTDQPGIQIQTSWGMKSIPAMLAFDIGYNTGSKTISGTKVTATETEIALGVRAPFAIANVPVVPYVGLGVEYGMSDVKFGGTKFSATGLGIWGDAGARYMLGSLGLGIDLRYDGCPVKGKTQGFTFKSDVGGFMPGIAVSYSF